MFLILHEYNSHVLESLLSYLTHFTPEHHYGVLKVQKGSLNHHKSPLKK